ncbi:hypothetical protein OAX35_00065 [Candidatus Pelagibacter ubique]|nr:hypothetical protein [Candidatus Pelagibacter ubique]
MSDFFFKYLDKKNKENRKKSRFYLSLQAVIAFIVGSLIYGLTLYRIRDQLITIWNDGFIMMFFSIFALGIPFIVICVAAYGVINSIRNPKRDWKVLLLYTVFIISFLSNKYYFQSVLGDYTVAFTVSFLVFIILCIFYNGINLEDIGKD